MEKQQFKKLDMNYRIFDQQEILKDLVKYRDVDFSGNWTLMFLFGL